MTIKQAHILAIILILSSNGVSEIVSKPNDTEAVVGHLVYFNCSSTISNEIHWFFHREGAGKQDRSIIAGYNRVYDPFKGRFRMEKNESAIAYNLIIDSVTATDAGMYECQEDVGRGTKSLAQLIVLESAPVCPPDMDMSKITGIETDLSCSVTFRGTVAPKLHWNKVGDANFNGTQTYEIIGDRAIYNVSVKVEPSESDTYYTCNSTRSISENNGCAMVIRGTLAQSKTSSNPPTCDDNTMYVIIIIILSCLSFVSTVILIIVGVYLCRLKRTQKEDSPRDQEQKLPLITPNATAEKMPNDRRTVKIEMKNQEQQTDFVPVDDADAGDVANLFNYPLFHSSSAANMHGDNNGNDHNQPASSVSHNEGQSSAILEKPMPKSKSETDLQNSAEPPQLDFSVRERAANWPPQSSLNTTVASASANDSAREERMLSDTSQDHEN